MTIHDPRAFVAGLWDWGFLSPHLPGKIRVGDADGLLEIAGNVLLIEAKGPNAPIPEGQRIMYRRLSRRPGFCVLVVWGEAQQPIRVRLYLSGDRHRDYPGGGATLEKIIRAWVRHALANPHHTVNPPAPG